MYEGYIKPWLLEGLEYMVPKVYMYGIKHYIESDKPPARSTSTAVLRIIRCLSRFNIAEKRVRCMAARGFCLFKKLKKNKNENEATRRR